jgi:hypothetical protein
MQNAKRRKKMKKYLMAVLASLTLMGAMFATPVMAQNSGAQKPNRPARKRPEHHPLIRRAINALNAAKDDLEDASHDFCGHRDEAREAANNALHQLQLALGADRASLEPLPNPEEGVMFQTASWNPDNMAFQKKKGGPERHPKIRQAIRALEAARGDLQNAAHDFNGHRVEALEATNRAISQLQAALNCDKR